MYWLLQQNSNKPSIVLIKKKKLQFSSHCIFKKIKEKRRKYQSTNLSSPVIIQIMF